MPEEILASARIGAVKLDINDRFRSAFSDLLDPSLLVARYLDDRMKKPVTPRVRSAQTIPPPMGITAPSAADMPSQVRATVAELERQRIMEALDKCAGNQTRAAEMLGISRRTLINRLDEYGIARPRKREE